VENIPALTGFRGFAALIVLLHHAGQFSGLSDQTVVKYGYFGVPCFFALSGALFAMLYFGPAETTGAFLRPYYTARFIRIFPVYWFVLALFAFTTAPVDWASVLWHVPMAHGFSGEYRHAINVPMWTLPVECTFYLIVPWLFVAMRSIRRRLDPRDDGRLWHWAHPLTIAGMSLGLLGVGAVLHPLTPNDADWWKGTLFGRFPQFGFGVLTGLFLADLRAGRFRLPRAAGNAFAVAAFLLMALQILALDATDGPPDPNASRWLVYALKSSLAVTACLLIAAAVLPSFWQRLLASRPLLYLGAISYVLYILQYASAGPVRVLSEATARRFRELGLAPWPGTGLTVLVCIASAMVVHHAFEKPVQHALKRVLTRRTNA
jgi:peptidoglycan/LPS O-acetylase OafA/YrhL